MTTLEIYVLILSPLFMLSLVIIPIATAYKATLPIRVETQPKLAFRSRSLKLLPMFASAVAVAVSLTAVSVIFFPNRLVARWQAAGAFTREIEAISYNQATAELRAEAASAQLAELTTLVCGKPFIEAISKVDDNYPQAQSIQNSCQYILSKYINSKMRIDALDTEVPHDKAPAIANEKPKSWKLNPEKPH